MKRPRGTSYDNSVCPQCGVHGSRGRIAKVHNGGRARVKAMAPYSPMYIGQPRSRRANAPTYAIRVYWPIVHWRDDWRQCDHPYHVKYRRRETPVEWQLSYALNRRATEEDKTKAKQHKVRQGKEKR